MTDERFQEIRSNLKSTGWGGASPEEFREYLDEQKRRNHVRNVMTAHTSDEYVNVGGVKNATKIRQFTLCQFEFNPRTGDYIQSLTDIITELNRYKSFSFWAYAVHDKDIYTQDAIDDMHNTLALEAKKLGLKDEGAIAQYVSANVWATVGDRKPVHVHIVVRMNSALEIWKIANWLGVPEHLIHIVKGKGALLDCTEYLTHEDEKQQALGKYRYDDSAVHTSVSFEDWRQQLDTRKVNEAKYGKGKTNVEKAIIDVLKYGKTVLQCYHDMDPNDYINNLSKLQKARAEYLLRCAEYPNTRITFYVCGEGGEGKGVCCRLLARALCPDLSESKEIMFAYGDSGITFDSYDGQPVILFSDMRAVDFMAGSGRKTTLSTVLEAHPDDDVGLVNVKFGYTKLIHKFNIINGVDPYEDFIKQLAGEYTDKQGLKHHAEDKQLEQFYRRVPIIIPIDGDCFDILVNTGIFRGTREYDTYMSIASIVGNFGKLQRACGNNKPLMIDMSKPLVDPIVETAKQVEAKIDVPDKTEEQIRAEVARMGYGIRINGDGSTDAQTQREYELFVETWKVVYPDKPVRFLMSIKEWVVNGRHTHYDAKKKLWYRPDEPLQLLLFDDVPDTVPDTADIDLLKQAAQDVLGIKFG